MAITALVDRFGSNRNNAHRPAEYLRGCSCVAIPFCGGMCELLHIKANVMLVNDLDRHVINLAEVVRTRRTELVTQLDKTLFHPDILARSQEFCKNARETAIPCFDWAYHYFIASWMTRGGKGGTDGEFDVGLSIRWKSGGGDSVVRFRSATESLTEWEKVAQRCTFTTLDAFEFIAQCKKRDVKTNGIYCFLPSSTVRMADERIINIANVLPGDIVAPGKQVLRNFSRDYNGTAVRLRIQGLPDRLEVTAEHPIAIITKSKTRIDGRDRRTPETMWKNREVKEASEISIGDWVLIPTGGVETLPYLPNTYKLPASGPQPKYINVKYSEDFFRFIGYYAAEGHLNFKKTGRPSTVVLSFGIHELDTFAKDAARCILESTNLIPKIVPHKPHPTVTSVRIGSSVFSKLILDLVPGNALTKKLNDALMTAKTDLQLELLKGWLRGDGGLSENSRNRNSICGTSASETLARQMFQIATRCGLRASFKRRQNNFDVYFPSSEDVRKLGWTAPAKHFRSARKIINGHILSKVTEVEHFPYIGKVFNIEVDGDHLFCAPFALAHNCDPPWPLDGNSYTHKFNDSMQERLATELGSFEHSRIVVRFGEHVLIRKLYPESKWTWNMLTSRTQANDSKSEVLLVNKL